MIFDGNNFNPLRRSCKTYQKDILKQKSLPHFQFRHESIDADMLATITRIESLAGYGGQAIPKLIPYIADESAVVGTVAINHLKRLVIMAALPLRFEVGEKAQPDPRNEIIPKSLNGLLQAPDILDMFVRKCVGYLKKLDGEYRARFLARLAAFPGMRNALTSQLHALGHQHDLKHFENQYLRMTAIQFPSQVGLSPTMACQLKCPYCISSGLEGQPGQEISLSTLHSFFTWARDCRIERVGLTGGEPTLYRHFSMLLKMIKESRIDLYLATNGLTSPRRLKALIEARPLCITVHLTPEVLHAGYWTVFARNVKEMLDNGLYLALRCNFLSLDDDVVPFVDAAKELKLGELRFAFPMPNSMAKNRYVSLDTFQEYKPLLSKIVKLCHESSLTPLLAKPFPICMMSDYVRDTFIANGSLSNNCSIQHQEFSNNMVIFPDTSFSPCLGLSIKSEQSLFQYHSPHHAAISYKKRVQNLMQKPLFFECKSCPLFAGGQCVGACLSYRMMDNGNKEDAQ